MTRQLLGILVAVVTFSGAFLPAPIRFVATGGVFVDLLREGK
ncbi:MAG: hypothetical protein ABIR33_04850 [Pyrinomonadaceae bacterium]